MINQIYDAYDIHLNSNNELMIAKYKVYDENVEGNYGKIESFRRYNYVGVEVPQDITLRISELKQEEYLPMNRFRPVSFDVEAKNPLIYAKLMILGLNHQILEKFYSLGYGYDDMDLTTYITYINMNTGKVSSMEIGRYKVYDDMKIRFLEDQGYVPEERSFYHLAQSQELDSEMKR